VVSDARQDKEKDIVLISDEKKEFDILCEIYKTRNIHWIVKFKRHNTLIWQKSYGHSISKLRKCLKLSTSKVIESHSIVNNVVIISVPPGMGKSTELTNLAQKLKISDPNQWVLRVNLIELSGKIKDLSCDFKDNISGKFLKEFFGIKQGNKNSGLTRLENELFNCHYEQGEVVLLLDGFDEICPIYKEKVFELLKVLKESKIKRLFVTTRIYGILHELEDKLLTFSYTFRDLEYDEKIEIMLGIWSRTSKPDNIDSLKAKAEKLLNHFEEDFYESPLQIRMVATVFQDNNDSENNMEKLYGGSFNLADLYERFVQILFNEVYIQNKNPGMHKDKDKPETVDLIEEKQKSLITVRNCS
jgi:hypothetical protein